LNERRKSKNRETWARKERGWREVEKIVGPGLLKLPEFFRNGLYRLLRAELADNEIVRACERCQAWFATAKETGFGRCECGCDTYRVVNSVNKQGQSVWFLDHDPVKKRFRGILFERCNREIGDGDRQRKWAHVNYVEAHEARMPEETVLVRDGNEFGAPGAAPD
jgi:hypothetical protein